MKSMETQSQPAPPQGCPKYLKLAKGFERQLRIGTLRVGDRLPSVRQLRAQHCVSVGTAIECYLWLERQGYVRAYSKSGFYVTRTPVSCPEPEVGALASSPVVVVGTSHQNTGDPAAAAVQLGPAIVDQCFLPLARLNRSIRLALSAFEDAAVTYEEPRGNIRLRRQMARLMFRQGATCSPDEIVVTSGGTEALNLAIRAVAKPGDVVAVESPGCYEKLQALEALQMRALELPHQPRVGVDLERLESAARKHRLKAIMLNSSCHNPLGDCLPDAKKAAIVAFAAKREIAVIETDIFGELVFHGPRPHTLKAFDTDGIVLQCSSLAHYLAPGFNLGWIQAGRWQAEVERLKSFTNVASARLTQLALAEFLESGAFEKHLKQLRVALWRSVEATRDEVLRTFPAGSRVSQPEGGFVLWIQLPERYDGLDIQRRAAAARIHILAGEWFSPTKQYRNYIRISCGHPFEVIQPAVRTLAGILNNELAE
jgi:DNA-binding transcriptional MocR family regulator